MYNLSGGASAQASDVTTGIYDVNHLRMSVSGGLAGIVCMLLLLRMVEIAWHMLMLLLQVVGRRPCGVLTINVFSRLCQPWNYYLGISCRPFQTTHSSV